MDAVKINFCGFWGSFKKDDNLFTNILSRRFRVEISDEPDFVICSNRGKPFEYMKYDCVRLMFMGENLSPDFTAFDYVIGFDRLVFGDRYFRLPFAFYFDSGLPWKPERLTAGDAEAILRQKTEFCNFIYGHPSSHGVREKLFAALNDYKRVVSPGRYLNNVGTAGCSWAEKNAFLTASKFTIACDSIRYPGFVTEKVVQPLQAHSVPVYFGSPTIGEDVNENAVVLCGGTDDASIRETVERVRWLDEYDDAYLEMLTRYPLPSENAVEETYAALEAFLFRIFSQSPADAARRIRYYCADLHDSYLQDYMRKNAADPLLTRTKRALKNKLGK